MTKILTSILATSVVAFTLFLTSGCQVQNSTSTKTLPIGELRTEKVDANVIPDEMPSYPGGTNKLMQFLKYNIKYPIEAQKAGIQGRVFVTFVVKSDGSIININVMRSVSPVLDQEAVRVVSLMPNWKPARKDGVAVNCSFTLPVNFKLR